MADVVIIGYLCTFLLINVCYGGLPGLDMDPDRSPSAVENHLKEDPIALDKMMVHHPRYKCHQCDGAECSEGRLQTCGGALACYKSTVRRAEGTLEHSRGCFAHPDHYHFTCRSNQSGLRKRHAGSHNTTCCAGELCNAGGWPALGAAPAAWPPWAAAAAAALAAAALSAAVAAVLLLRRMHRLRASRTALHKLGAESGYLFSNVYNPHLTSPYYEGADSSSAVRAVPAGDSTLREYLDGSASSGSGGGLPLMVQRTLARQVALRARVARGRRGEVWRALWCADTVAVKIFLSRHEDSWRRETEMYSTVLLRHDNILAYIGSDMTSRNTCTQLWLITQYHPLGSLREHLARGPLSRHQMALLCLSLVDGLLHLHTDIHGTQGKPAIAHRALSSRNVLVKADGSCCIADLGLAVTRRLLPPPAGERGPHRYLSPELLDDTINTTCLEAYRKSDMYALGLLLWEVCARVGSAGPGSGPPFADLAPADPSVELMRKLVCVDQARPTPNDDPHPTMAGLARLQRECWHQSAAARLPALRVKKTLLRLFAADPAVRLPMQDHDLV